MIDFNWDILIGERQILEAKADAARAQHDTRRSADRIRELEFAVHRMALASQAMWEILRSRVGVTEPELIAKIHEIDLRDGTLDQRMAPRVTTCQKCDRPVSAKSFRCIYCGTDVPRNHAFQ